jgi:hypothetical protein
MRPIILLLLLFAVANPRAAHGQTSDDSVRAVVHQALDALARRDTAMLRDIFTSSAQLVLVSYGADSTIVRSIPIRSITASLSSPGPRRREELRNERILAVSDFATVTAEYIFFFDDKPHHCGTAMYDLARFTTGWRIVQIRQTDRRAGCRA